MNKKKISDISFSENESVLIIVDIQNDGFKSAGGLLAVPNSEKIVLPINDLRKLKNWKLVILTQDFHPKDHVSFYTNHKDKKMLDKIDAYGVEQILWPPHCVQGTKGVEIFEKLDRKDSDIIIQKGANKKYDSYSAFQDNARKEKTKLEEILKKNKIKNVFVCGICFEWCCMYTALDAKELKFNTYFVEDCSLGANKNDVKKAKEKMKIKNIVFCHLK